MRYRCAGLAAIVVGVAVLLWVAVAGGVQPYETYEGVVGRDGPVAQFRFGDAAGSGSIADSAGSYTASNDGVVLGREGPFPGSKSGSFGGEAYAALPGDPLKEASSFSVEGWVDWASGSASGEPVFDLGSASNDHMFLTPSSTGTKHVLALEIVTPSGSVSVASTKALTAGVWEYVAVTEESESGEFTLRLYLNGELVGKTKGATITPASLGASVPEDYLGKSVAGSPSLDASLSNVAFYTKALSANQVEEHYDDAEFPVNSSAPEISGTPREGNVLTAHEGSWTGLAVSKFAFQWELCTSRECSPISGATKATFTPVAADMEGTLQVAVKATNGAGSASATSARTKTVEGKPVNTALPVLSGEAKVGQLLSVGEGNWRAFPAVSGFAYAWEACKSKECAVIEHATGAGYRIAEAQLGKTLRAVVTAKDQVGEANATSAASAKVVAGPPVNVERPVITGAATEGQELTASTGVWAGSEPIEYDGYSWLRCTGSECSEVQNGRQASKYTLTAADVGHTIKVRVYTKNSVGFESATSSATSQVTATPQNSEPPKLSSETLEEGQTLSATAGSWSGTPPISFAYQWQSCNEAGEECADIEGAEGSSYQAGPGDVGNTLRVLVTASNEGGAVSAASRPSAVIGSAVMGPLSLGRPEISGSAQTGETLRASVGQWTGSAPISYAYQWERCDTKGESCADIAAATGSSYRLGGVDVGSTLRIVVTATNSNGMASRISAASAVVAEPSACTDSWVGRGASNSWQEGANWSTGSPPGPGDIACAGTESEITVTEGNYKAGAIEDAGRLTIFGVSAPASLELTEATMPSSVASLTLFGAETSLTGAGNVYISSNFGWHSARISGSGSIVLESSATGVAESENQGEPGSLSEGRTLVNEGTFTFGSRFGSDVVLDMSKGARIENDGTFVDNSEASHPQIQPEGSGAPPTILNTGTFERTESETGTVAVPFTNDGIVDARSGKLEFTGGGVPEQAATGSWSVEPGAAIVLAGGTFLVGEAVNLSHVTVEGATVIRVSAPVNTAPPSIAGTAEDGQKLTAEPGSWSGPEPITFSYRWQRCNAGGQECRGIANATDRGYTPGAGEIGATVRVLVTASDSYGQTQASSPVSAVIASPPPPSNTAAPTINGLAQDGSVLTASTGSWDAAAPVSYSYQWESCDVAGGECAPVEYATGASYQLSEGDLGSTLRVVVTATNVGGSTRATSAASAVILAEPVSELEAPSISGSPDEHQVLHADPGGWAGTETQIGYQWESCSESASECAPVEGATGSEYDLTEGDVGSRLRVRVGASNARDSLSDVSAATPVIGAAAALANVSAPTVSGAPQSGQVLTASPGAWSGSGAISYLYQWQSCNEHGYDCEDIQSATAVSYTPPAGEAGHRLRVLVTASDEEHSLSEGSPVTQPVAAGQAPVNEQGPAITGPALAGQTLTAGTGVFAAEGPISYAYQWQRCSGPGECSDIEGATQSSYTLTSKDVGSSVLVLVTAAGAGGSTTAVTSPTETVGPEALLALSPPTIAGVVQPAGTLTATPGIWSAEGLVSYAYQWESCDSSGEACAPVEGATDTTYEITSNNLGSTLRVKVTATSPLGSTSALSAPTAPAGGGEVSVEEAQTIAEHTDPALLASSTTATLEEQSIAPALTDGGEELTSDSTLTTSTVSKETAGALAVNTPAGEISLAPVEASPHTIPPPTIVNGTAALLANTWPATDTITRPEPLGTSELLDIRAPEAPRAFSWEVGLGPDEELRHLPDGAIAIVETPEETSQPSDTHETGEGPGLDETSEGPAETSEEKTEAEQAEAEQRPGEQEEEVPLPTLPAAPTSSISTGEATPGEPQPQNAQSSYEAAKEAMSYAETQTGGEALMTIAPPAVTDAEGNTLPATLTTTDNTITLTIKPRTGAPYPLLADTTIAAPTNKQSTERDPVRYGISDPKPQEAGHIDEHFNENGAVAAKFDPRLYDGPPHTTRHIRTARLIVPYDVLVAAKSKKSSEYRNQERAVLETWLQKVTKEGFEPYITISQDFSEDPCGDEGNDACPEPSVGQYKAGVTKLMQEVIRGHTTKDWKLVKLWGAWNEPDAANNPLHSHKDRPRAAQFWEVAQTILHKIAPHYPCGGCTVVAGEFSTFYPEYTSCYRDMLLYDYCVNSHPRHPYARYWSGKPRDPAAWGFHDYEDLLHRNNTVAHEFAHFVRNRLEKPRLFMSEAGVELQAGQETETELGEVFTPEDGRGTKRSLQLQAAEEFLKLPQGLAYPIDRMYYYQYTAPNKAEQEKHDFDSALLEEEASSGPAHCLVEARREGSCAFDEKQVDERRERPAYCVLAYEDHRCPPQTTTGEFTGFEPARRPASEREAEVVELTGTVNANGTLTEYRFEYGPSPTSLHSLTPLEKLNGLGNTKVGIKVAFKAQPGCFNGAVAYFRVEATNETGTRHGRLSEVLQDCVE